MRGIILAAGRGSRMQGHTTERPKGMVELHGRPLIAWQLASLRNAGIRQIAIVCGYREEDIVFSEITKLINQSWCSTNMVSSLACAASWLHEEECLVSYSDIIYSAHCVKRLIEKSNDIVISYDPKWLDLWKLRFDNPLDDAESFKMNHDGELIEIGKKPATIEEIEGQYMGLLKFSPSGWKCAEKIWKSLPPVKKDSLDMTSLLNRLLEQEVKIQVAPVFGPWCEVDSEKDLQIAHRIISSETM